MRFFLRALALLLSVGICGGVIDKQYAVAGVFAAVCLVLWFAVPKRRRRIRTARSTAHIAAALEAMSAEQAAEESDSWKLDPASNRQKEFADDLGIEYPENITKGELSALISARTER